MKTPRENYQQLNDLELQLEKEALLITILEFGRGDQRMSTTIDEMCRKLEAQVHLIDEILRERN